MKTYIFTKGQVGLHLTALDNVQLKGTKNILLT